MQPTGELTWPIGAVMNCAKSATVGPPKPNVWPYAVAGGRFADALDGAMAAVRNARWRKVICAESLESLSPENETARLKGRAARPAKPGLIVKSALRSSPTGRFQSSRKCAGSVHFRRRRSFVDLRTTPVTGRNARRGTHVLLQPDGRRD